MKDSKINEGLPSQPSTWGSHERIGLTGWLSLYVSGGLVVFFLLSHLFVIHFISGADISAQSVYRDLRSAFLSFVNIALLILALFHGLMGLRRIILDLNLLGKKGDRALMVLLLLVGLVLVLLGIEIFRRFNLPA